MSANSNLVPTTELEAVNLCLSAIGEAPVSTLNVTGLSDVSLATQKVREASRAFQSHGWSFNRDNEMLTARTLDGWLVQPADALSFDISRIECRDGVIRGGKLWDTKNHTFVWDRDLKCDVVRFLAFDDLPEPARYYLAIRAARMFARSALGTTDVERFTADDEQRAWGLFRRTENRVTDRNVFKNNPLLDRASDFVHIPTYTGW
jgi:hypothetical protein